MNKVKELLNNSLIYILTGVLILVAVSIFVFSADIAMDIRRAGEQVSRGNLGRQE